MNTKTLKIGILVLSIIALILVIAQFAVMAMPFMNLTPTPSRKVPDPEPRDYSILNFLWTDSEDITKIFNAKKNESYIKGFEINDYVIDFVLVNLFAVLTAIFLVWDIKNYPSKYVPASAGFVKWVGNICLFIWGGWSLFAFTNGWMLDLCDYPLVITLNLVISIVVLVVAALRTVAVFTNRTRYKVVKPTY